MILSLRLNIAIIFILGMALILTTLLSYFQFESSLAKLQNSRISVITLDIKRTVESGTNLGIELNKLRNVQDVIDRARNNDVQILSITVFDESGRAWFSTGSNAAGAQGSDAVDVGQRWVASNLSGNLWASTDEAAFVVGAPILNSFDKVIGGVAVRYSRKVYEDMLDTVFSELRQSGILVFLAFVLFTMIAVFLVFRRLTRTARRMDESLSALLSQSAHQAADVDSELSGDEFSAFRRHTREALAALDAIENRAVPGK